MKTTGEESLKSCPFCGNYHSGSCPLVEEIEYYENGTIKKVKFKNNDSTLPSFAPYRNTWENQWPSLAEQFYPLYE